MKKITIIGKTGQRDEKSRAIGFRSLGARQAGFSLTEVLVATFIFAIIFVAALMIYDRSNRVFKQGVEASDSQQSTRVAFDTLVSDLRMAGFDYDRDGIPTGSTAGVAEQQQPDEQLEFAGRSAITIRANFDYETQSGMDNGRESGDGTAANPNYESPQFPVVTTGNDEIVTYALRSGDASKNTDEIEFFADVSVPRNAFPGGSAESKVTIPAVDLSNENPPYTLYRFTLTHGGELTAQPLADNVRSLTFTYFEDATGQVPLTNISGTAPVDQEEIATVIGGLGQFDPNNPNAALNERTIRSKVRSIRAEVVGMNETIDGQYTDPYETVASAENYRKYALESLIVPRNFGKRGMKEQSVKPPGPPTLDDVCFGLCGMAQLTWTPAPDTGAYGAAEQYAMLYSTDPAAGFDNKPTGAGTTAWLAGLDPTLTYSYAIRALNGYGAADSVAPYDSGQPWQNTSLKLPVALDATNGGDAVSGGIQLDWKAPDGYLAGKDTLTCTSGAVKPAPLNLGLIQGYRLFRARTAAAVPATAGTVVVASEGSAGVNIDNATASASFFDKTVAPCKSFYYRVRAMTGCPTTALGPNGAVGSGVYPPGGTDAIEGIALSTGNPPKATINLAVDTDESSTGGSFYTVKLNWPRVSHDTKDTPIGVDDYVVNRSRRKLGSNDPWKDNPIGGSPHVTTGLDMGNEITYTDTTAELMDTVDGEDADDGGLWEYQYTVQAQTCSDLSAESVEAVYPPPCTFTGSPVIQSGASQGTGTAANPWLMDAGDAISVSSPAGTTLTKVVWNLYDSTGSAIETVVDEDASDGFLYVWKDLVDSEIYRMLITITNDAGCIEQKDRYIQDAAVSPCTVAPSSVVQGPEVVGLGQNRHRDYTITIDNTADENLNPESVTFTWADAGGAEATLTSISYPGGAVDTAFSQTTPGTVTEFVPGGTLSVTPTDTSYNIVVRISYKANKGTGTLDNPISSFCFSYGIASEPGDTKHCNVVGLTTGNPGSCSN